MKTIPFWKNRGLSYFEKDDFLLKRVIAYLKDRT